ncbi:MAG TPA: VWA domain-containing protein [Thermoanaerobaculia bacterium]|nr:VWA domain-containing protein [Thermoanaerobaculia bacterium]
MSRKKIAGGGSWWIFAAIILVIGAMPLTAQTGSPCGPMDVVFVVDTTGSMGGALESVKADLNDLIIKISFVSGGDFRLGLVEFSDDVIVLNDLAGGNLESVSANILALSPGGGANEPEASDEALNTVINGLKAADRPEGRQTGDFDGRFRADATKIIVLVTDARPAGFDDDFTPGVDDAFAHELALQANARDIRISSIFVPTPFSSSTGAAETIERILKDYASVTGGRFIRANEDGTGTGAAISEIILSCGGATFFISVQPLSAVIANAQPTEFLVTTTSIGRFSADLVLSAAPLPEGSSVSFDPPIISAPGTGSSIMTFTSGAETFPGVYFIGVVATSADGFTSRSTNIKVEVECRPPFIFGLSEFQPASQTIAPGQSARLTVVPNGSGPFRFQWYRGQSASTEFPIEGATTATFVTPPLTESSDFWVRVRNACGSYDSFTANVTVSAQGGNRTSTGRSRPTRRP